MADDLDVLTLAEAKQALSINTTDVSEDDILARYITSVSRLLDQRIGPTVARTVTAEEHWGGCTEITLRYRPVLSIASLTEYTGTTGLVLTQMTATSQPTNGYRLDPYDPTPGLYSGCIYRTTGTYAQRFAYGHIVCTYTAGRVASTTAVDARIKKAAEICLENLWRDRQQSAGAFGEYDVPVAAFPTFAFPRAAEELLAEETGQHEPWGIA